MLEQSEVTAKIYEIYEHSDRHVTLILAHEARDYRERLFKLFNLFVA